MSEIVAVDFRGNEIRVGDTVLYPRMSGRSCEMTEARVERIDIDPDGRRVDSQAWLDWIAVPCAERDESARPVGDATRDILPAWRFSLMPLRSTRFRRYNWGGKPQKPVYVRLGDNVVVPR